MHQHSRLFRLSATVALGALLSNTLLPVAATAQPAPPQVAQPPVQPDQSQGDPPARVGRITGLTGTVSFRTSDDTQWSSATTNYPVASGNAFWTEPSAQATLEVSSSRVTLAPQTEFDVTSLDSSGLQAVTPQGEAYLHLADLSPSEVWSVETPRGQIRLTAAGRYGIVAGTTDQPTLVTVLEGSAEIDGPGLSLKIAANETATITGSDPFQGSVGPAIRDAFLTDRLNAERPPPRPAAAIPAPVMAQVAAMPGGEDLTSAGSWSDVPEYGQVWYPPVSPQWVPYRQGHWAYVEPWGWTWIDDAPWGFAPFHYGRWVQAGGRWCWTPGRVVVAEPPVYAPALVTFFGVGVGVAVGVGLGAALAHGSIGWVPLGPREPYHPWYHASDAYFRRVNVAHVTNITNITNVTNVTTVNNFINRGAATSVPASVMTGSRPVQAAVRPLAPQMLASARPVFGQQPLRPTATTVGVTPAVARQLRIAPAGAAPFHAAPGPVVRAQAGGPVGTAPGAAPVRPPLAGPHGEQPGAQHPGPSPVPGPGPGPAGIPGGPREPGRPPALVPPGARPPGVPVPPGSRPEATQPHGIPPTPTPPGRIPPATTTAPGARPEGNPHPGALSGPENRPAAVERPAPSPHPAAAVPEVHPIPPPHAAAPVVPHVEAPRPAPPHVEAPRPAPPHIEAPRMEAPRPAPPRFEAPRMEAPRPPPPHIEVPRPAPPHIEAPRPAPPRPEPAQHQKRPGEP